MSLPWLIAAGPMRTALVDHHGAGAALTMTRAGALGRVDLDHLDRGHHAGADVGVVRQAQRQGDAVLDRAVPGHCGG